MWWFGSSPGSDWGGERIRELTIKINNSTAKWRLKGIETIKQNAIQSNFQVWDKIQDLASKVDIEVERSYPKLKSIAIRLNELVILPLLVNHLSQWL